MLQILWTNKTKKKTHTFYVFSTDSWHLTAAILLLLVFVREREYEWNAFDCVCSMHVWRRPKFLRSNMLAALVVFTKSYRVTSVEIQVFHRYTQTTYDELNERREWEWREKPNETKEARNLHFIGHLPVIICHRLAFLFKYKEQTP